MEVLTKMVSVPHYVLQLTREEGVVLVEALGKTADHDMRCDFLSPEESDLLYRLSAAFAQRMNIEKEF